MHRFLHVANGTCTADVIQAAGIPGVRSIWADPLYDGPVPGDLSDDQLLDVRARFLADGNDGDVDPKNDLRRWRSAIADHDSYDELILWYEHDLFDQLNLIQLVTWLRSNVPASKPVSLVCIGSFPGRPRFKGLGELTPGELAPLLDTRQPVTDAQLALAERAWQAFRDSSPEALDRLRRSDTGALPYLAPAITRFLQEYPWTNDGLSRCERRLLALAGDADVELLTLFPRMHDDERAYYITDGTLASMAQALSETSPPLLVRTSPADSRHNGLGATVRVTAAGRGVLAGERDRVKTSGIDRWLGGVHLVGRDQTWRWHDGRQQIVRA